MTLAYMRAAIALQTKGDARFLDYCNLMFNSGDQMFWGQDWMEFVREALR